MTARVASKLSPIRSVFVCHPSLELPMLPIQNMVSMPHVAMMPEGIVSSGMSPRMLIVMMPAMQWASMTVSIPMHDVGRRHPCGPGVAVAV